MKTRSDNSRIVIPTIAATIFVAFSARSLADVLATDTESKSDIACQVLISEVKSILKSTNQKDLSAIVKTYDRLCSKSEYINAVKSSNPQFPLQCYALDGFAGILSYSPTTYVASIGSRSVHKEINNLLLVKKISSDFIHMTNKPEFDMLYGSNYQNVVIGEKELSTTLNGLKLGETTLTERNYDWIIKKQAIESQFNDDIIEAILKQSQKQLPLKSELQQPFSPLDSMQTIEMMKSFETP